MSPADIDAQLDELTADIAAQTSVRPEKDGGVTMQGGDDNGRYLTAEQYRNALTACTTSAGGYDPAKPADQKNVPNPSIGQPTTPTPGAGTPTATIPAVSAEPSPSQVRTDTLAATGSSAVWVAVGAVAVLVAGIGALVASRRAKN